MIEEVGTKRKLVKKRMIMIYGDNGENYSPGLKVRRVLKATDISAVMEIQTEEKNIK